MALTNTKSRIQIGITVVVAVAITALGIDAFDTAAGSRGTLLAQLFQATETSTVCPEGMVHVPTAQTFSCVDRYEVAPDSSCPHSPARSVTQTETNMRDTTCTAKAQAGMLPWTYVTRTQATTLCAREGKRLPTAAEWYQFAIGVDTQSSDCVVNQPGSQVAGSAPNCQSSYGVYDVVGNVWEWVSDDVFDGQYNGRRLPMSGYVTQVDAGGVPVATDELPADAYGDDYFWSDTEGVFAMLRGGFYASQADAGIYAVHARTDPNSATAGIGFRCVR